jgi:O-antigen/teichoic acid export membrane protein
MICVAWVFEGPGSRFYLLALAAVPLLFHAPAGAGAIFNVDMTFKWSVFASVAGQSVWLLGTLGLAVSGVARPAPYLVAFGLGTVLNGSLNYLWGARRIHITYHAGRAAFAKLWREAWPAGVSMTMASVYFFIDTAMLRPLAGEVAVAHYSVAYRIMTFVLMVPVLFSNVLFPVFSRLWALGAPSLRPFFQKSLGVLLALGLTVFATVPLISVDIMSVVYEQEYRTSAPTLVILCIAIAAVFAAYPHVILLLASGHQRVMMVISTLGALLNVGMNLWAIPRYGIEGAAWTTVATEGFIVCSTAVCGWRITGVRVDLSATWRPVVCAASGGLALYALLGMIPEDAHVLRVIAGVAVAAGIVFSAGILPMDLGTEEGAPSV